MKRILTIIASISLLVFLSTPAFGQQIRDSYKLGGNLPDFNTFKESGYVFSGNIRYYITDTTVLASQNDIDSRRVDTLIVMSKFAYKKKAYLTTGLKEDAFYQCFNLHTVFLPDSFTSIAPGSFWDCYSLTSVNIPSFCETIGASAFRRTKLTSFVGNEGLQEIHGMAFFECHRLEYVELPSTLRGIGARAFSRCDDLRTVQVHFTEPVPIDEKCFFYTTPIHSIKLIVPRGCASAFKNHPQWGRFSPIVEE